MFLNITKKGIIKLLNDFLINDNDDVQPVINVPLANRSKAAEYKECKDIIAGSKFSCVDDFPLAMAYVPFQKFENLYPENKAHERGTLFMDLDMPYGEFREMKGAK